MITLRLDTVRGRFFDRAAVMNAVSAAERRVLARFGAFVRQRARTAIRLRRGTSRPGDPPFSHTGLLRQFIVFAFDPTRRSAVIGPVRLNQKTGGDAPRLLEYGGSALRLRHGQRVLCRYRPRPFMTPAFRREWDRLPPLWRDSIR